MEFNSAAGDLLVRLPEEVGLSSDLSRIESWSKAGATRPRMNCISEISMSDRLQGFTATTQISLPNNQPKIACGTIYGGSKVFAFLCQRVHIFGKVVASN